jgi:transposase InsO family protein
VAGVILCRDAGVRGAGRWGWRLGPPDSDAGSQFTSIRYGERAAEMGAARSIGTVGDSNDNALAEAVNGYYKAVRGPPDRASGRRSRTSSSRPLGGRTGTTRSGSTATSATSRPWSSRTRSMLSKTDRELLVGIK